MRDPSVCTFCGLGEVVPDAAEGHGLVCAVCGWRVGDAPDADLPRPRVDVVYYLRWHDRIKIGTSAQPRRRLAAILHEDLLAFELGDRTLERTRHAQFARLREGGEWFRAADELLLHAAALAADTPPWHAYARWMADALRRTVS
ncbi:MULTISPECIES: GIY-YIG nuclease family protein [unclassified Microbacterium]|uniref:GIY-YIG nuclease family protein n=1 Tax=unclassified Microbacterium TaxID=2609290 RepID=UPI003018D1E3